MREMQITRDGVRLHIQIDGDDSGPPVMFSNSLGTSLHLWDDVLPHLPSGLRLIRYDMRGHGKSDVPLGPYSMGALVSDAEAVADALDLKDTLFVGLSVGGMVAQGLAVKRLDLIRAMVLSNTAAKIGNAKMWQDRIAAVRDKGMAGIAPEILARWFGRDFLGTPAAKVWHDRLAGVDPEGYTGVCAAIAGTDFFTPTSGLRLPTLGISGSEDKSTPPDLVRETIELIPGSRFHLMRRAGHLPCVEQPEAFAAVLSDFMRETGHIAG